MSRLHAAAKRGEMRSVQAADGEVEALPCGTWLTDAPCAGTGSWTPTMHPRAVGERHQEQPHEPLFLCSVVHMALLLPRFI